ncbi:MAG: terminase small subunit [Planctomycetes bacterium]|nr:terminase small subunit [Planctomycetota bacterium]
MSDTDKIGSQEELAKLLSVSVRTLCRWRDQGLPSQKTSTGGVTYSLKKVKDWLANRDSSKGKGHNEMYKTARAYLMEYECRMAKLQFEKMKDKYVPVEDVKRAKENYLAKITPEIMGSAGRFVASMKKEYPQLTDDELTRMEKIVTDEIKQAFQDAETPSTN